MAFCSACGAQVTGPFCGRCGAPAGAPGQATAPPPPPQPQAPPPPQPSYQAAPPPPPQYQAPQYPPQTPQYPPQAQPYQAQPYQPQPVGMPPVKKGTSPIVWILLIVGGLFVLGIIGVVGTVYFVAHKVKQAGFDPELMRTNPGLAITKMVTAANPDVEVLNSNDRNGTITVRDRKTGKIATLRFDDVKNGHFSMNVQEDGKDASLNFGTDVTSKMPSWVPSYPGANMKGGFSATSTGDNGDAGTFSFTTSDSADRVREYYEGKAKDSNMQGETTTAAGFGTVLTFKDESSHHQMGVTIIGAGGTTTVNVSYANK